MELTTNNIVPDNRHVTELNANWGKEVKGKCITAKSKDWIKNPDTERFEPKWVKEELKFAVIR